MYTLLLKQLFHLLKYEYCLSLAIFTASDELHLGDKIHWLSSIQLVYIAQGIDTANFYTMTSPVQGGWVCQLFTQPLGVLSMT